jgi:predicted deacetylase
MQTSRPALIVSIHDVSPLTREAVEAMLQDLRAAGVARTSLLVIPNHHHKAPLAEDAGFCEWLRNWARNGQEIVLHGYYHKRPARKGDGARSLITEHYTAGEGEFFDLTEPEAAARLEKAKAEFAAEGFHPTGFIAPAWLLGPEAEAAVKKAGFGYTTRLKNFKDLGTGQETPSQSLVWSVRSGWRRRVSLWWNAWLAGQLAEAPLLRVGLHPPDWKYPEIRDQALNLIRTALAGREVLTYDDWLARLRAS